MTDIKVSVVIPVYNVEKYIDDCVKTVCAQTLKEIEIILVDDGSTDNGAAVCEQWVQKDARVRLIRQPNQGVSVARNKGIETARGEWIAFIDSDDWIDEGYLEVLYETAVKNQADVGLCGFYYDYPDQMVARWHFEKDMLFKGRDEVSQIQIQILAKNMSRVKNNSGDIVGAPWCKLFNTRFLRDNELRFIPGLRRSQDVVFNLYSFEKAQTVAYVNKQLYHYRQNQESICRTFSKKILSDVDNYLREMKKFIGIYHKEDVIFKEAFKVKVTTSVYKCLFQYFFDERYPGSRREMKEELKQYLDQGGFRESIRDVKYKNLELTEKVFAFCLKHELIGILQMLVRMRQKFIRILKR